MCHLLKVASTSVRMVVSSSKVRRWSIQTSATVSGTPHLAMKWVTAARKVSVVISEVSSMCGLPFYKSKQTNVKFYKCGFT